jgi:hypothetical protein
MPSCGTVDHMKRYEDDVQRHLRMLQSHTRQALSNGATMEEVQQAFANGLAGKLLDIPSDNEVSPEVRAMRERQRKEDEAMAGMTPLERLTAGVEKLLPKRDETNATPALDDLVAGVEALKRGR